MKLLIVDDNKDTRKLIGTIMKPKGHEIVESSNGIEALKLYATHRPDCVLMDIEMPGMDGIKATQEIKSAYPEARVVIVTMFDDPRLRAAAIQAGAERYVLKDNLADLHSIIGR